MGLKNSAVLDCKSVNDMVKMEAFIKVDEKILVQTCKSGRATATSYEANDGLMCHWADVNVKERLKQKGTFQIFTK